MQVSATTLLFLGMHYEFYYINALLRVSTFPIKQLYYVTHTAINKHQ